MSNIICVGIWLSVLIMQVGALREGYTSFIGMFFVALGIILSTMAGNAVTALANAPRKTYAIEN